MLRGAVRRWCSVQALRDVAGRGVEGAMRNAESLVPPVPPVDEEWGWKVGNIPGSDYVTVERDTKEYAVNVLGSLAFTDDTLHGGVCSEIFPFTVLVTTRKGCIRFECLSLECNLRIVTATTFTQNIQRAFDVSSPGHYHLNTLYKVPCWDDQSNELIIGFQNYLIEVGITPHFLEYLSSLLQHKELMEYPAWWAGVEAFLDERSEVKLIDS